MATWSSRRKLLIGGGLFLVILIVIGVIFFSIFYKAPTCFDRVMNGGELGIDCGGNCELLCQSTFLSAKIAWGGGKFEKVAPSLYNVAAYILNPNTDAAAVRVPYKFMLFDNKGLLITEKEGRIDLPAHRNTLVFEPALNVGQRIPTKVTFEFTAPPVWFESYDALEGLAIGEKKYSEDETSSSLEVSLENKTFNPMKDITVGVVLYDIDGNAIGFSRTKIDELPPQGGKDIAPFTWPIGRDGKVVSVEALPVTVPQRK